MSYGHKQSVLSRRNFLMHAFAGAGALTFADRLALAEQIVSGKRITLNDIDSAGLPPGLVRLSSNENPLGPSPLAMEAVEKYKWNSNRYSAGMSRTKRACRTVWIHPEP